MSTDILIGNAKTTVLFIDFDGVICDSLNECIVSSWIGYYRYLKKNEPKEIAINFRKLFLSYRSYIRSGNDYILIQELMERGIRVGSNKEFDRQRKLTGSEKMELYTELFYRARDFLLANEFEYWLRLNTIFPHVVKPLRDMAKQENIHILSTKKAMYNEKILNFNGIKFPMKRIHYSSNADKISFIKHFLKQNPKYTYAILIDDQIDNILGNTEPRIKTYLALWGFIDKKWLTEYPEIPKIDRDQFVRLLEDLIIPSISPFTT